MPPVEPPAGTAIRYSRQYRRCGKADCAVCGSGRPGHGPYWFAVWQESGRKRTRYLGREAPPGVADPDVRARASVTAQSGAVPLLRVRTLGGFVVWRGADAIPAERWQQRKVAALLKLLLSVPGHRLSREQAIEWLWPETEPAAGARNLRNSMHRLRGILGGSGAGTAYIRGAGDAIWLAPAGAAEPPADWLDADNFAALAAAALTSPDAVLCRAALARYTGEYLPEDRFEEWAERVRDALRGQYLALQLHLAELCEGSGDPEEAARALAAALEVDSCHEEAARALMRLHAAMGRPLQAIRTYRRLATALHEDLDLEPEAETQALYRELLDARPTADPRPADRQLPPTNLPSHLTSFVGRRQELTALRQLLLEGERDGGQVRPPCRLLTLIGPGGCGKTRLALQVADEILERFPDGVWVVELATLPSSLDADPGPVARAVATTLGLQRQVPAGAAGDAVSALQAHLVARSLLLVLDNCEHLVAACAALADALLLHCPALRVLATSREVLGVAGEHAWPVPPLSLPSGDAVPLLGEMPRYEAVRLFVERARLQRPGFTLTEEDVPAVAAICRRLDGMPLAIELAAARLGALSAQAIATRLDDRFRLLTGGSRTALPHQRTLRATLDWSHALLGEAERILFRRLSVFAGGWTLEAAEAVCGDEDTLTTEARRYGDYTEREEREVGPHDVLDALSGLVGKSLVQRVSGQGATRYAMLETILEYAREQLSAAGEADAMRERHLAWCLHLAEETEPLLWGAAQAEGLARLEAEHDNLRAALAWSTGDWAAPALSARGMALAGLLWRFWWLHGHFSEGRAWLEAALARGGGAEPAIRARALNGAGNLALEQGDYARASALHEEGLALRRRIGDQQGVAASLGNLGLIAFYQGEYARARTLHQESLGIRRSLGDTRGIAASLCNLARISVDLCEYETATGLLEEGLALYRQLGDTRGVGGALNDLGNLADYQGAYGRAMTLYQEALDLHRGLGHRWGAAITLGNMGSVAHKQGEYSRARALHLESLAEFRAMGDKRGMITALTWLALALGGEGRVLEAVRLAGAADALRESLNVPLMPGDRLTYDPAIAAMRARLGDAAFQSAWASGRALDLETALNAALSLAVSNCDRSDQAEGIE